MTQIPRVKLTLNKYMTTWEGKVLRYLHDRHPSKRNAANMVMDLTLAAWLPYVMSDEGVSDAECSEAALYSVQFLLSHACAIRDKFDLPCVEMQGFVGQNIGDGYVTVSAAAESITPNVITDVEEDDGDDEILDIPDIDAEFPV